MKKDKIKESLLTSLFKASPFLNDKEFSRRAMDMYWERVDEDDELKAFTFLHYKKFYKNEVSKFDSRLVKTFSRDENQEKIKMVLDRAYKRKFGLNAQNEYGIDDEMYYDNMTSPTRDTYHLESKFFPHDDDFRSSIQSAPKIPVERFGLIDETDKYKLYSQRVLFKLDEEVMCGEIIKKQAKEFRGNKTGSSMMFIANYRGMDDYKFVVDRWDYRPGGQHINFFDEYGKYNSAGLAVPNTQFSHSHQNTFKHRSIFGPFVSPDIAPTPINNVDKRNELIYQDFESMADNFLDNFNVFNTRIPTKVLNIIPLKELGDNVCPSYGRDERYVVYTPKGFYKTMYDSEANPEQCLLRLNVKRGEGIVKGKKGRMIELEQEI